MTDNPTPRSNMPTADDVLSFWAAAGMEKWYRQDDAFDAEITTRFGPLWQAAHDAGRAPWQDTPKEIVASSIVLDQFPRNMFRADPRAFATDAIALDLVKTAIARDMDLAGPPDMQVFFYMPLEHSEDLADQDAAVAAFTNRMSSDILLLHARAHRRVIRQFGRFPFRNAALGRVMTPAEQAFMDAGAYGAVVRALEAEEKAKSTP